MASDGIVELRSPMVMEGVAPGAAVFGKIVFGQSMFGYRIIAGSEVMTSRMTDIVELKSSMHDTVLNQNLDGVMV